jgi:hypothetical protein
VKIDGKTVVYSSEKALTGKTAKNCVIHLYANTLLFWSISETRMDTDLYHSSLSRA